MSRPPGAAPGWVAKSQPDHDRICADIRARIAVLPAGSVVLAEDETAAVTADEPGWDSTEVDGRPAVIGDGVVVPHGLGGFAVEVLSPLPRDPLLAYARSVRIVDGAHRYESKWTDRPIRS